MISFWNQTITRLRPGTKVERGSTVPDWDNASALTIKGCSVQPSISTTSQDGRVLGISDSYSAYLPKGADVRAGDHIVFDGEEFAIDGEPRKWTSPTGRLTHVQINLVRWHG